MKEKYPDQVKLCVRFSLDNLKLDDMLNIPLICGRPDGSVDWDCIGAARKTIGNLNSILQNS